MARLLETEELRTELSFDYSRNTVLDESTRIGDKVNNLYDRVINR